MSFLLNPLIRDEMPGFAEKVSQIKPDLVPERILKCNSSENGKESQKKMLQELLHLPSLEIQKYVEDAFNQDWPFLPPTINTTMMKAQNTNIPDLTEVELLLLCLNFALENEEYRMALSISMVVDRFVYWCDGSVALLNIVDHIKKVAPSTPLAPQLVIRKARVLKDTGNLHGSMEILKKHIKQKWENTFVDDSSSRWQYKTEDQYINVCAVCVQIMGQIYHNLGLWKDAIPPLMESVQGFKKLPVEDLKGSSYSYSLLSRCLCRLSRREYRELSKEYSFIYDHHYHQAYLYGIDAYRMSPGQSIFMSKHLLQSGECLLMYTVQLTDGNLQHKKFCDILGLFAIVIYYQKREEFSQSKDQLFIFIKTLFVISLTFGCSYYHLDRNMSKYLEKICMFVYEKFCEIGANQLDSDIGKKKFKEIFPAIRDAYETLRRQYVEADDTKVGGFSRKSLAQIDIPNIIDSIINPKADVQERLRMKSPGKENQGANTIGDRKVNKLVKQERVEIPLEMTPIVDCDAVTKERVKIAGEMTPIVDCNADTQEMMEIPGEMAPIVDCSAETKERVKIAGEMTPIVDCNADTQEMMEIPGEMAPIVDCGAETKERVEIPIIDCKAGVRLCTNTSNFDSHFENMGSLSARQNQNSSLTPRIVGLPTHVSNIKNKVSSLAKLSRKFDNFNLDADALADESKDLSFVNTSALAAIRESKKDGTFSVNRILNKFQREVSLDAEPQVNIPPAGAVEQESLSSYLGKLLHSLGNQDLLPSSTNSTCGTSKWNINSMDKDVGVNKVQKATLYQYNPVTCVWSGQDTIVCTGKELTLGKGKKGSFRNVYEITFLHQDEPLGRYVSKRYRDQKEAQDYMDDVVCQMQAGLYVNLFNQELKAFELDLRIYFLTAAFMHLYDSQGEVKDWVNIEAYVDGEFLKLTNNYDFCHSRGKEVSTSFMHFTYVKSGGKMMVTDLQGWLPTGSLNLIYLTDPQFHTDTGDSSPFDFGLEGIKVFFDKVHPECNKICKTLNLNRPTL